MNSTNRVQEVAKAARLKTIEDTWLDADLILPPNPIGVVVIGLGTGSSRLSPRNRFVASVLRQRGLGTFLLDTESLEERDRSTTTGLPSVELPEMAKRILLATEWLGGEESALGLPVGCLGAGRGAAATLIAAAEGPRRFRALVVRGARIELASDALNGVVTPVLLIVGARDEAVVHHNRDAIGNLGSIEKRLEIIPGAHHLFEEPGALATVAMHTASWFAKYLVPPSSDRTWHLPSVAVVDDRK
jgi:pimeloyl-ACP methyl ester carboxylesterase